MKVDKKTNTKVTLGKSLKNELNEKLSLSNKSIENTGNEARTFWVGYNQAIQDLISRFFSSGRH